EHAWIEEIKSNNKQLIIIECCEMIAKRYEHDHHHHHDHNSGFDPHIWTSPNKVIQLTSIIQEKLIEIDNKNAKSYKASAEKFKDKLNRLDEKIRNKTTHLKKRDLVVTHPSWSYFADQYDFNQLSIEVRGKELQASSMTKLISHVKEKEIRAVFSQPQFSRRAAEVLARETGAKIIDLDPLAFDYIENMNDVVDKIVQGMSL
ncbi:MAG: zinc ABC transporter substrate-binding protein, partial [Proteobacteria bacterium]|nr:zinc ABC transporter substrate-binding protein [Pseudomonadota bacterium]